MARAESTDFLQNFRFHVTVFDGPDYLLYGRDGSNLAASSAGSSPQAGFQSVTLPDETFEASEYREGIYKYTKKFPGIPTYSDVSMMRGITVRDTSFYNWGLAQRGGGSYRADVAIEHHHRENVPSGSGEKFADIVGRKVLCYECMVTRSKPGADLDATSGEVALAELDFALEYYEIETPDGKIQVPPTV